MSREEAESMLKDATTVRAEPGDRVIREGERGDTVFVLTDGVAEVLRGGSELPVAVLGPGDSFGELAFLTGEPRSASVVARTSCEMLVLSGGFLNRFIEKHPESASKALLNLSRSLAERLAATTAQVVPNASW
ncbi:MAG: cyclic nucleotide-binding domain-containing protein [Kofleriaceae bacterium]|nr:cyclic nucleotide-binding domain-containing protein [Kofleriaceae bacterium]